MKSSLLFLSILLCMAVQANEAPAVSAGPVRSVYLPVNSVQLNGSASDADNNIQTYQWTKISGPSQYTIASPGNAITQVNGLVAGEYNFQLQVTDALGANGKDTVQVIIYNTANVAVPSVGNYPNLMGANPGYYGNNWNDIQVYSAMANAGCRSTRSTIPMFFFGSYGDSVRYAEMNYYYNTLGFRENVFFLYNDVTAPFPDRSTETFNGEQAAIPTGLYLPIWNDDGSVNMNNTFARYCYKTVKVYGAFSKYYEIWNEPDFTNNWGIASALPGVAGNWWENDPNPSDMLNVKAPIQYYIRMLRVAYEVIKRYQPDGIITLGGLGYPSFMHALLRNTDNPVPDAGGKRGSVTADYPLKAGAYFDGLSFHSYPQYFLKFWDYTTNAMSFKRHSDEAIDQTIRDKNSYLDILRSFGYGTAYPNKPVICTEINIPRKALNQEIGGIEVQRNFAWKAIAKAARNNISQMYWYVTGEVTDHNSAGQYDGFKMMGLYENLLRDLPGSEKLTDEGKANKSAQLLLQDFFYDDATTASMELPGGADGVAFRHRTTGEIRFMLWAKTHTDESESSQLYYAFPTSVVNRQLDVYKWNYCITNTKSATIQPTGILLTGEPVILVKTNLPPTSVILPSAQKPLVNAGRDTSISVPFIVLQGTASHPENIPMQYYWDLISMSGSKALYPSFKNRNTLSPSMVGLQKGVYAFRFTATDERGLFSSDTVLVAVDTTIAFPNNLPIAYAGRDTTVFVPDQVANLSAAGSMDPDGTIVNYQWNMISGPGSIIIQNPSSALTAVTGLVAGAYFFEVVVTDNMGASSSDQVRVLVDALLNPNKKPIANAGRDTVVYLPVTSLFLSSNGSHDPDGKIVEHRWKLLAGPSSAEISNASTANPSVSRLKQGTYVFQLSVTDDRGAIANAKIRITVRERSLLIVPEKSVIRVYINEHLSGPLQLKIFDPGGRLMKESRLVNQWLTSPFIIDINHLKTGLYFACITDVSGRKLSQAFLKQ
ncbi:MAG: hypothetical protein WCF67_24980 [Chitinophagaceae bacterium]